MPGVKVVSAILPLSAAATPSLTSANAVAEVDLVLDGHLAGGPSQGCGREHAVGLVAPDSAWKAVIGMAIDGPDIARVHRAGVVDLIHAPVVRDARLQPRHDESTSRTPAATPSGWPRSIPGSCRSRRRGARRSRRGSTMNNGVRDAHRSAGRNRVVGLQLRRAVRDLAREAHVVERERPQFADGMRRYAQADVHRIGHGDRLCRADLRPRLAVGGHRTRRTDSRPARSSPSREPSTAAPGLSLLADAPLAAARHWKLAPIARCAVAVGRDDHHGVLGAGGRLIANHDAALGPGVAACALADDAGGDRAVAGELFVHELEGIGVVPDVVAVARDFEGVVLGLGLALCRRANRLTPPPVRANLTECDLPADPRTRAATITDATLRNMILLPILLHCITGARPSPGHTRCPPQVRAAIAWNSRVSAH